MSASDIQDIYPVDMDDHTTAEGIRRYENYIDHGPTYPGIGGGLKGRLSMVTNYLAWLMSQYPRKPNGLMLKNISGWRCSNYYLDLPDYRLPYTVDKRDWDIEAYWYRPSSAKSPHIKVSMYNAIEGKEDALIREEVLTILGVMIQRLNSDGLEKQVVAPVMLLSFMGECHGRILMAYFDGDKLVIQKSKLYRFYSDDRESYLLFLTYLAAEEGPADTMTLLLKRGTRTS